MPRIARPGMWLFAACLAAAAGRYAMTATPEQAGASSDGPRFRSSHGLARLSTGAIVRDDFESARLDERLWRVWISDPGRAHVWQNDGRLWIDVRGTAGYNGLVSLKDLPTRDVEAVCRAGIVSGSGAHHGALVHLCGSGALSPDHWIEVDLRDRGGKASASINVAVPPELRGGYMGTYELPPPRGDGYLLRVTCDGWTGICRGYALAPFGRAEGGEWWQLGDGFRVPARRSRLEIKTAGSAEAEAESRIWFDDCRLYPGPRTHGVTVILKGPDGSAPTRGGDCFGPDGLRVPACNLIVRLYDGEGARLVAEAGTGTGYGYAMLSLDRPGWDIYPVAAVIRVFANDRQIGPDHVIRRSAVEGLYPDDVYQITLD